MLYNFLLILPKSHNVGQNSTYSTVRADGLNLNFDWCPNEALPCINRKLVLCGYQEVNVSGRRAYGFIHSIQPFGLERHANNACPQLVRVRSFVKEKRGRS